MGDLRERSYLGWFDHEIEADKERKATNDNAPQVTGTLTDASWVGGALVGRVYGDVKGRFRDGESIRTSTVLKAMADDIFVTRNSVYKVDSWSASLSPANDNPAPVNHAANINALVSYFHGKSKAAGWWNAEVSPANPYVIATKLMLCVSELAEAMEGLRKDLMDDKLPHRKMGEVELGDALIRICDLAGALGYDLGGATMEKDAYNDVRADHKPGARMVAGGKRY